MSRAIEKTTHVNYIVSIVAYFICRIIFHASMHIWIYFENELLRRQLKSGSSPNFFDTNVHGIEEVLNVLMIEMNKGIWYIYWVD